MRAFILPNECSTGSRRCLTFGSMKLLLLVSIDRQQLIVE